MTIPLVPTSTQPEDEDASISEFIQSFESRPEDTFTRDQKEPRIGEENEEENEEEDEEGTGLRFLRI